MQGSSAQDATQSLFESADWYDRSINWRARLTREVPLLVDLFGPPGQGGLLDAGCGTGRQAVALAERGYRVVGADADEAMIEFARAQSAAGSGNLRFVVSSYETMPERAGAGFDGVYCVGNALAAAGSRDAAATAVAALSCCLRPGGRLFVQILNFPPMRREQPCVRGPRLANVAGREYISFRHFVFYDDHAEVTNVTLWHEGGWRLRSHGGRLHPIEPGELRAWCAEAGLRVDHLWGGYAREPWDADESVDVLLAATRL